MEESAIAALVVEDDQDMAIQLKRILSSRFEADVSLASSLEEARGMMSEAHYDVVTLDYMLPDGEGLSLLEEITSQDDYARVIMVTGHGGEDTAVRSFHLRASGYVVKDARLAGRLTEAFDKALVEINLKRAEEALRKSEEHFRSLIENAQDVIAVIDSSGDVTYASPSLLSVLGHEPEKLEGTPFLDIVHEEDREAFAECAAGVASGEMRLAHGDGTWHFFEWKCKRLSGPAGDVILNAVDITRRKDAEESLKAYKDHLEQLVDQRTGALLEANVLLEKEVSVRKRAQGELNDRAQRLSHFLTVASHELRHPISVVKGYTTMLTQHYDSIDPGEIPELLSAIDASTDRLTSYVNELLDVSRIEGDRFPINKGVVEPALVVESALNEMRARGCDNEFEIALEGNAGIVELDPEKLSKLLVILIENAVKFSDPGSTVTVEVSSLDGEVVFSVLDRGIGVPEEQAQEIFNRFYQVEDVSHHSRPGLGLGLYIASEIVRSHGGHIWCEPRSGGGSAFRFTLGV